MFISRHIFYLITTASLLVTSCGGKLPFFEYEDKKDTDDPQEYNAQGQSSKESSQNKSKKKGAHSEEPGGDTEYTLQNLFDATERATKKFPRGLKDPQACSKHPQIKRGLDNILNVTSWRPPKYDLWVRVDYINQCNNEPAKVYFWCHFHSSSDGSKHIACHGRGSATIDWNRLKDPSCESPNDCNDNDNEGGGLPLP